MPFRNLPTLCEGLGQAILGEALQTGHNNGKISNQEGISKRGTRTQHMGHVSSRAW